MPTIANFPEVWVKRLLIKISSAVVAPWLNDIPELDVDVAVINAGDMSEKNKIYVPTSTFEPDVLINNTTYPIDAQSYTDDQVELTLDKYQTKVTTLSDDQVIGASYDRIDNAIASHARAIAKKKYAKAAHSLAPTQNAAASPVIVTTGDLVNNRRRLVYADLVSLKAKMNLNEDDQDLVLVLCSEHYNDLLLDRQNFGNLLIDYNAGKPVPRIAGFEVHTYIANPRYSVAGVKKAFGSVPDNTAGAADLQGSFAFVKTNVAKKTGITRQYFAPAVIDPANQVNKVNYRHYFMALPFQAGKNGAIISAQS